MSLLPVGRYEARCGEEGVRYAWSMDGKREPYVESGAFPRRTKLSVHAEDKNIIAYTTSVSLGCVLAATDTQCRFCVTGNVIGYGGRPLTAQEIALQNVFMVLDERRPDSTSVSREFAYMGQGEPGLSYEQVKAAIKGTDSVMRELGIPVYRHIFATAGVPKAIRQLGRDMADGVYGGTRILLHLSIHSTAQRERLMPIDARFPAEEVIAASREYTALTGQQSVVNMLMFNGAILSGDSPFTTASSSTMDDLVRTLDPDCHRVILCEYNPDARIGTNGGLDREQVGALEAVLTSAGFDVKKFIAFGREDNLACGLLGGKAVPNIDREAITPTVKQAMDLIVRHVR